MTKGHGYGFGLSGPLGAAGAAPAPSSLSNIEVWLDASSYVSDTDPDGPGIGLTTGHPTNLVSGGTAITMLAPAGNHPYKMHANLSVDGGGPNPLPIPNGNKCILLAQASLDTAIADHHYVQHTLTTPPTSTGAAMIMVFYMHSHSNLASQRNLLEGAGTWSQFLIGGNCNSNFSDSSGNYAVRTGSAAEIGDAWHVLTWRSVAGGFQMALDGVEYSDIGTATTSNGNIKMTYIFKNAGLTTAFAEYVYYAAGHTMEDLNGVAAGLASKYGISYTYTPV